MQYCAEPCYTDKSNSSINHVLIWLQRTKSSQISSAHREHGECHKNLPQEWNKNCNLFPYLKDGMPNKNFGTLWKMQSGPGLNFASGAIFCGNAHIQFHNQLIGTTAGLGPNTPPAACMYAKPMQFWLSKKKKKKKKNGTNASTTD